MRPILLAWRNAGGNAFRSRVVAICAALLAGLAVSATILIGGARDSLRLARERLGADIIVVPEGAEQAMENAFLMGVPLRAWMPASHLDAVAALPGVRAASPQLFLSTLRGATCCSVPEMFLVAYDPATDFTLRPWLEQQLLDDLALGEAVGGSLVYVPAFPGYILVYGYEVDLRANLEPTGTGLDQSMFFTFETARDIARLSGGQAEEELVIPEGSISAIMVDVAPGADPHDLALRIRREVSGVSVVESTGLFGSQRDQIGALLRSVVVLLGVAWILSVALIGLVSSMTANERRTEIGVLRALGLTGRFVLRSLLAESLLVAAVGGVVGVALFTYAIHLFRDLIIRSAGVPFLFPAWPSILLLGTAALALALLSVTLGALVPALRISRLEPALAMRE